MQLLDKLDSYLMFLIGVTVVTFLGYIVCGSRFFPFFCGYALPLAYILIMLVSCRISLRFMFEQLRKEILYGKG